MRFKITEGDLIIVGAERKESAVNMGNQINEWLKCRGLTEVAILISSGPEYHGNPPTLTVLSVNDVFQDMVLDGKETSQKNSIEAS